jgi:hypothetical protein
MGKKVVLKSASFICTDINTPMSISAFRGIVIVPLPGAEYDVKSMLIISVANGAEDANRALKADTYGSP